MTKRMAFRAILATGVALTALPSVANAQSEAVPTSDIIVTAQHQQYLGDVPVKEIPQSVQVIDSATLSKLNVTNLASALTLVSGVANQNNFGGLWDSFAIRGFAGDENFPSGFLVNGFNAGRGYAGVRDASNIDTIEVLKGPNAAVFGRGEPGGTVNIITRKAKADHTFGSFTLGAGSFDDYRVEGDYNYAISDRLAVRVNGADEQAHSFRDTIKTSKLSLTPSIIFKPTATTTLTYELEYVNQDIPFDRGVVAVNGKLGLIPPSRFLGEPNDGPIQVRALGHQAQLEQDLGGDNWVLLVGAGYRDTTFTGYSTEATLAPTRQSLDATGNWLSRERRYRDYSTTDTTFRAEISGRIHTGPFQHHLILGTDFDKFNINLYQLRVRPGTYGGAVPPPASADPINIFAPVYGQQPTPTGVITNSLEEQQSFGVYGQDQIDVTDKLKLRFGGRYDHLGQKIGNRTGPFVPSVTDNTRNKFSPSAGVLYDVTPSLGAYFAYGVGYRLNSGQDAFGHPFQPESSKSYEVGLRYTAPHNLLNATVAIFTMSKDNVLTADPVNNGFSLAGGSASSKGVEVTVDGHLPYAITLHATYTYLDAHWTSASLDPNFQQVITPGAPLINIPKNAATLLVTKEFDLADKGKLTIGGGINYASSRLGETATAFYLPSYTITRLLMSYSPSDHVRLSLDVTNLFDVTWYSSSYSHLWIEPGRPRTVTGRATFSF